MKCRMAGFVVYGQPIRKRSFMKDAKPSGGGVLLGYAGVSNGDEQNNALQTKAPRFLRSGAEVETVTKIASMFGTEDQLQCVISLQNLWDTGGGPRCT